MLFSTKQQRAEQLRRKAERVLERYRKRWIATDGVVACGISVKAAQDPTSVVIKIYVRRLGLPSLRSLPRRVDGIPVIIEETGDIKALQR